MPAEMWKWSETTYTINIPTVINIPKIKGLTSQRFAVVGLGTVSLWEAP